MKKLFYSLFMMALTAMTFTSCEDVPMPYDDPNKGGGGTEPDIEIVGDGSAENPYNVASAIALFKSLASGAKTESMVYIKGKVSSIEQQYGSNNYGNAIFYISDDGSSQNQFYVYRALYLGKKKYTSGELLKEGDEVIICGIVTNYKGKLETDQDNAFLYSLNGVSEGGGNVGPAGEAKGKGTLEDPYNPAGVLAYIKTLGSDVESDHDVYIKGKVSSITEQYGAQYGNATFNIVEEGAEGTAFMVFRALYLGNKKYTSGDLLKEGDEVIVCGRVVNYRGNTPETAQGKAYLYSLNGKTEGDGEEKPQSAGSYESPLTVTEAIAKAEAEVAWVKGYIVGYVKGTPTQLSSNDVFFTAENASNTNIVIAASSSETDVNKCMPIQLSRDHRADFALDANPGMLGKEVIMTGQLTKYFGVPGIKNLTYIEANGKSVGNKVKYRKR